MLQVQLQFRSCPSRLQPSLQATVLSRGHGAADRSSTGSTHPGASGHGRHAHHTRPHRTSVSTAADGVPASADPRVYHGPGGRQHDSEGGGLTAQTSRRLGSPCSSSAGLGRVPLQAGKHPLTHWARGSRHQFHYQHDAVLCVRC